MLTPRPVGPYTVGHPGAITVHAAGVVEAVDPDDGTVTIGGRTYPTRLDLDTVRHVSIAQPGTSVVVECDGDCAGDDDAATRVAHGWHDAVREAHDDDQHPDPFRVCAHALCRRARSVYR